MRKNIIALLIGTCFAGMANALVTDSGKTVSDYRGTISRIFINHDHHLHNFEETLVIFDDRVQPCIFMKLRQGNPGNKMSEKTYSLLVSTLLAAEIDQRSVVLDVDNATCEFKRIELY